MAGTPKFLFHCTQMKNLNSIMEHGLIAGWGRIDTAPKFSYFVKSDMVAWGIAHVAVRHHCGVDSLCVIRFEVVPQVFKKFFGSGVYRTIETLDCTHIYYHSSVKTLFMIEKGESLTEDKAFMLTNYDADPF